MHVFTTLFNPFNLKIYSTSDSKFNNSIQRVLCFLLVSFFSFQLMAQGGNGQEQLPLELSNFEGTANGCTINLTWQTFIEKDFDRFEVEWSSAGQQFTMIKTENGAGGYFTQNYSAVDISFSKSNYYRLKMIDLDGKFEYSDIISISTSCVPKALVYPNPVKTSIGFLNLSFESQNTDSEVRLIDMFGRVAKRYTIEMDVNGQNTQLDISGLATGVYILNIKGSNLNRLITLID